MLKKALAEARVIKDEGDRAETLTSLAFQLAELSYFQKTLAEAKAITDKWDQAKVLTALVLRLVELRYIQEALTAARAIKAGRYKAEAMAQIAHHLQEPEKRKVLKEALKASETIEGDVDRDSALAKLASRLAELGYPREALNAVRKIQEKRHKVRNGEIEENTGNDQDSVMARLASRLAELGYFQEAITAAYAIKFNRYRAEAMVGLAYYHKEPEKKKVLKEALEAARNSEKEFDIRHPLARLVPRMAELGYSIEAVETARKIRYHEDRAIALGMSHTISTEIRT